ncbi:hypothetical protein [Kineococcus sp. SYSU DK005]|uniref:hypothetical protein n=1 Tax=Kineococcus sp. SYSU DK005 TaxID=3383126 RepID=UPI003D7D3818
MSGAHAPRWSGPGFDDADDADDGFDGFEGTGGAGGPGGGRWTWAFRLLLPVAASPVLVCAAVVARILVGAEPSPPAPGVRQVFADRWTGVLQGLDLGWACTVSALLVLLLAGAVAAGRPRWAAPTAGDRTAVAVLAVALALVSAVTGAVSLTALLQQPTELQAWYARTGVPMEVSALEWAADGALHVLAALVAAVAAGCCGAVRARAGRPAGPSPRAAGVDTAEGGR